jgi:hypothetical protein
MYIEGVDSFYEQQQPKHRHANQLVYIHSLVTLVPVIAIL